MDAQQATSAMADALIERGIMTREQVDAGMAQEQAQEASSATTAPSDESAPRQGQENAPGAPSVANPLDAFETDPAFAPPEDQNGYRFRAMEPLEIEQVKHVNAIFHAAKVPQVIAQQIYADVERLDKLSATASDAEWALMTQRCDVELQHAWGSRYEEMAGHFRRFVNDLAKTQPKIMEIMTESPASNSSVMIRQLAEHAARLYSSPRKT